MSIIIQTTGVYIPKNKVYNDFFIEHFDKQNVRVEGLMNHLGRRKRYLASQKETSLSMACEAVKNCIDKSSISYKDLNMLVFVSDIPEYLSPTNALKIVNEFQATNVSNAFDLNGNCSGMPMAIDIVTSYMQTHKNIEYAIVVGSFNISSAAKKDDSVVYPNFADASSAVLLHREDTGENKGYMDSISFIDASYQQFVTFPECGISKIASDNVTPEERQLEWQPFDMKFISNKWYEMIIDLTARNHLVPDDIDFYILSQLSDYDNMQTLQKLGIKEGKYFFLGKEYGYTGNTCMYLVLNRMWQTIAKPGNKVIFCTVGAGYSAVAQLYYF